MKKKKWITCGVFGLLSLVSSFAAAASAPAAGKEEYAAQTLSLADVLNKGGVMMYVLGLTSVVGVALVIYLSVTLRKEQIAPAAFRRDVLDKIKMGSFDDVRTACSYKPCPLSEIAMAAVDFVEANNAVDQNLLKDIIEGEGSRQAATIQGQTQYLLDVAVISPMIGLLGTVFGMVHAFGVVALDLAKAKPMLLAAGVAEALVNTAGGLIVGIPAMMFYAYFRNRSSRLVSHLESASTEILTALVKTIKQ